MPREQIERVALAMRAAVDDEHTDALRMAA
jgi:hypothetical protein